jgi:hypothetical protein
MSGQFGALSGKKNGVGSLAHYQVALFRRIRFPAIDKHVPVFDGLSQLLPDIAQLPKCVDGGINECNFVRILIIGKE